MLSRPRLTLCAAALMWTVGGPMSSAQTPPPQPPPVGGALPPPPPVMTPGSGTVQPAGPSTQPFITALPSDENMLFPPKEQTPGREIFAVPVPNGYDARSDRTVEDVYDQAGVIGSAETSPPIRRRPYPYHNDKQYWYGHDADVESWGNLLELPYVRLGWFANLDTTVYRAEVKPHFAGLVTGPSPAGDTPVTLGAAGLNWSVSPKLDIGYRFEHGLGEITVGYRYLNAYGADPYTLFGPDGRIATNVNLQTIDLDWCVQEFHPEGLPFIFPLLKSWGRAGLGKALTPNWFEPPLEMRWIFGIRGATMYYNTVAQGALARESVTTNFNGAGLNFGVDLNQRLRTKRPWYIHARAMASGIFGFTDQRFERTVGGTSALGLVVRDGMGVPVVCTDIGISYRPSFPQRNIEWTLAWQREQWFSFASTSESNADIVMQGVLFRGEYKY